MEETALVPVEIPAELQAIIKDSKVEESTGNLLIEKFQPFLQRAKEWADTANKLVVTDVSQKDEMEKAREARLALREIRISADKTRKNLKEDSLRYGKAVQGVYNVIESAIKPIEEHLEKQERFAEIQEANRKAELKNSRLILLQPFAEFAPMDSDFGNMSEVAFQNVLKGAKLLKENDEKEKKEEKERLEKVALEQDNLRKENEKLRQDAEKLQRELKQKEDLEKKEREEKERLIREQKAAERKKAKAPDKVKLAEFADWLENSKDNGIPYPVCKTEEAQQLLAGIQERIKKVANFIRTQAEAL